MERATHLANAGGGGDDGFHDDPEAVWPPDRAARFLCVKKVTLEGWRREGNGPRYVRLSKTRVGYRRKDLVEFVESRLRQSTAAESASTVADS